MLGLWQHEAVEPRADNKAGDREVVFTVANAEALRVTHEAWKARGLKIAQAPTAMNFGNTFFALDPDGHRLRVLARRRDRSTLSAVPQADREARAYDEKVTPVGSLQRFLRQRVRDLHAKWRGQKLVGITRIAPISET